MHGAATAPPNTRPDLAYEVSGLVERNVWLKDLYKLEGLLAHVDDSEFQARWADVKRQNKERLALFVERQVGIKVDAL
jgi:glucan phosphorylase